MITELEQLNRGLDQLVQERTAAFRERETELQAQNLPFDEALKNMAHGLCMFDRYERLIVCNERYTEIYGLTPIWPSPGRRCGPFSKRAWPDRTARCTRTDTSKAA